MNIFEAHNHSDERRVTRNLLYSPDRTNSTAAEFEHSSLFGRAVYALEYPEVSSLKSMFDSVPEMHHLVGASEFSCQKPTLKADCSLSEFVFGKKHARFDQMAKEVIMICSLLQEDYQALAADQGEGSPLTPESFAELSEYTKDILQDKDALDAFLTLIVLDHAAEVCSDSWSKMLPAGAQADLSEIEAIAEDVLFESGDIEKDSREILSEALKELPDLFPTFAKLKPRFKKAILKVLSAEFNIVQLVTGESPAGSLIDVAKMGSEASSFSILHAVCQASCSEKIKFTYIDGTFLS